MRISKFASGVGVALLAAVGAFATAKTYTSTTYYYQSGATPNECISTVVDFTCSVGTSGCISPSGHGQLYRTRISATTCETTLKRP